MSGGLFQKKNNQYSTELTPREKELLWLILEGHGYKKCAEIMVVSETTIKTHINNIFQKEQVNDRGELIAKKYKELLYLPPEKRVLNSCCALCERSKIIFQNIYEQEFDYRRSGYWYAHQHKDVAEMMLKRFKNSPA